MNEYVPFDHSASAPTRIITDYDRDKDKIKDQLFTVYLTEATPDLTSGPSEEILTYIHIVEILKVLNEDSSLNASNIWQKIEDGFSRIGESTSDITLEEIFLVAIRKHHTNVMNIIINHFDINCKNKTTRHCFYAACQAGEIDIVKKLVEKGVDVNWKDSNDRTAMHYAAKGEKLEMLKYLVNELNAKANAQDVNGHMPFHVALIKGSSEIVKFFANEDTIDNCNITDMQGRNVLFYVNGNLDRIKYLIDEKNIDYKVVDQGGCTLVHNAASNGYLDALKLYIDDKQLDFDVRNRSGATPLYMATSNDCELDVVEYLVEKGADVNVLSKKYSRTPIWGAAMHGNIDVVKYLISKGAEIENNMHYMAPPLIQAALHGHVDMLKYFLNEMGANPCVQATDGLTPLHYAFMSGKLDIVKLLADDPRVDCNIICENGINILFCTNGHVDVMKYLIEVKNVDFKRSVGCWNPLFCAASRGYLDIVKYLVEEKHVNPSEPNDENWTALYMAAVGMCDFDVVKYFVNRGEDVNAITSKDRTPISAATNSGRLDVVKYLLSKGGDINVLDVFGFTPVLTAAERGHFDLVKFFVEEMKVDISVKDINDRCILQHAVHGASLEIIKYLIECHKADKLLNNRRSDSRCTALHEAITKGYTDIAKYLISKGSSVHASDFFMNTSLHKASRTGNLVLVEMLIKKKAYVNCINSNGDTPLHLAAKENHLDVVKYLLTQGADANLYNKRRATALRMAASQETYDVIQQHILSKMRR